VDQPELQQQDASTTAAVAAGAAAAAALSAAAAVAAVAIVAEQRVVQGETDEMEVKALLLLVFVQAAGLVCCPSTAWFDWADCQQKRYRRRRTAVDTQLPRAATVVGYSASTQHTPRLT